VRDSDEGVARILAEKARYAAHDAERGSGS